MALSLGTGLNEQHGRAAPPLLLLGPMPQHEPPPAPAPWQQQPPPALAPLPSHPEKPRHSQAPEINVGTAVRAKHLATKYGSWGRAWYDGVVTRVNHADSFDIKYDDGDEEEGVRRRFIKPRLDDAKQDAHQVDTVTGATAGSSTGHEHSPDTSSDAAIALALSQTADLNERHGRGSGARLNRLHGRSSSSVAAQSPRRVTRPSTARATSSVDLKAGCSKLRGLVECRGAEGKPETPDTDQGVVSDVDGIRLHLAPQNSTGYAGVHPRGQNRKRFVAQGSRGVKGSRHLGTYATAVEAAVAYAKWVAKDTEEAAEEKGDDGDDYHIVSEVDGLSLHLAPQSTTGYACVFRKRNARSTHFYVKIGSTILGTFATAVEAAVAYASFVAAKEAAKERGGEAMDVEKNENKVKMADETVEEKMKVEVEEEAAAQVARHTGPRASTRVRVVHVDTGRMLTGNAAPRRSKITEWLLRHPGWKVDVREPRDLVRAHAARARTARVSASLELISDGDDAAVRLSLSVGRTGQLHQDRRGRPPSPRSLRPRCPAAGDMARLERKRPLPDSSTRALLRERPNAWLESNCSKRPRWAEVDRTRRKDGDGGSRSVDDSGNDRARLVHVNTGRVLCGAAAPRRKKVAEWLLRHPGWTVDVREDQDESRVPKARAESIWVQCDECLKWRRVVDSGQEVGPPISTQPCRHARLPPCPALSYSHICL